MLQNEPLVAKIGVDTAENEPIFGWIQLVQLSIFNSSILSLGGTEPCCEADGKCRGRGCDASASARASLFAAEAESAVLLPWLGG